MLHDFLEQTAMRNELREKILTARDRFIFVVRKRKLG